MGICEAYYQRLIHEGQFEIARKAFRLARSARPSSPRSRTS